MWSDRAIPSGNKTLDREGDRRGELTELPEAGVLGIGDGVAHGSEVDVGVVPHLPVFVEEPLLPGELLRLLQELLVLRRHGRRLRRVSTRNGTKCATRVWIGPSRRLGAASPSSDLSPNEETRKGIGGKGCKIWKRGGRGEQWGDERERGRSGERFVFLGDSHVGDGRLWVGVRTCEG